MSSGGGNKAVIDLIANPDTLEDGFSKGTHSAKQFADDASKSMSDLEVSVEKLEAEFKKLADTIVAVVEANTESTKASIEQTSANEQQRSALSSLLTLVKDNIVTIGVLTAVMLKSKGTMVEKTSKVLALGKALGTLGGIAISATIGLSKLAGATIEGGKYAYAMAGSMYTLLGRIALTAGGLAKLTPATAAATVVFAGLAKVLDLTGHKMTAIKDASDQTLKIIQKYNGDIKKISAELDKLGITAEEAGIKQVSNWTKVRDEVGKTVETVTHLGEYFSNVMYRINLVLAIVSARFEMWGKGVAEHTEKASANVRKWVDLFRDGVRDSTLALMGFTDEEIHEQQVSRETERLGDIHAAKEKQRKAILAEAIKLQKDFNEQLWATARAKDEQRKIDDIAATGGRKALEHELARLKELQNNLINLGKYSEKAHDLWTAAVGRVQVAIDAAIAKDKQWLDANEQIRKSAKDIAEEFQNIQIASAKNVGTIGLLRAMLDDELELMHKIGDERGRDTEEYLKSLARVEDLKRRIHDKEQSDVVQENDAKIKAINDEIAKKKELKELNRGVEDTQRSAAQDKKLREMDLQGATAKAMHEQRMKFIKEEEELELKRLENPSDGLAVQRIKSEAAKNRIREVADFERQQVLQTEALKEVQIDSQFAKQEKVLIAMKENGEKIHKLRIKEIDEEEQRRTATANTELEKLRAKNDAERNRDREKLRFEKEKSQVAKAQVANVANNPEAFKNRDAQNEATKKANEDEKLRLRNLALGRRAAANAKDAARKKAEDDRREALETQRTGKSKAERDHIRQLEKNAQERDAAEDARKSRNLDGPKFIGPSMEKNKEVLETIAKNTAKSNVGQDKLIDAIEKFNTLS